MIKFKTTFVICVLIVTGNLLHAQTVGTTASYGCDGNSSEGVFFIMGNQDCGPIVGSSGWSVVPSAGVTITPFEPSTNPVSYNAVRIKFSYAGDYSIRASYSCNGNSNSGTAFSPTFKVYENGLTPSLSIAGGPGEICNVPTSFVATAVNGGETPTYHWKINGEMISGQHGPTFTTPSIYSMNDGDVVSATVYSTQPCVSGSATSNLITINKQSTRSAPADQNLTFCDFEPVVLSAPITTGLVKFKWFDNGNVLLGEGQTMNLSFLREGTYTFSAEPIDDYSCAPTSRTNINVTVSSSCDDKLNWTENISYDQAGETSHTKSYFDLAGGHLQSQVKLLSSEDPTDKIITSGTVVDRFGRKALSTLLAPTGTPTFRYKHHFITNTDGNLFTFSDLGESFGSSHAGTVGWYYSASNNKEQNVPQSGYPYSQVDYYTDGYGKGRRIGGPGEVLRLHENEALNHVAVSGTFPVFNELNDYLMRRRIAGISDAHVDNTLFTEGVQSVSRDQNGHYAILIADKSGSTVFAARNGGSAQDEHVLAVTNQVSASGDPNDLVNYRHMIYFYLLTEQVITIASGSTGFIFEDILNDVRKPVGETFAQAGNGKWPAGFYRVLLEPRASANDPHPSITFNYVNYFTDLSYSFYDEVGRLKSSVSPNGMKAWIAANPQTQQEHEEAFDECDHSTFKYSFNGLLLSAVEPDAGETKFLYRKDGLIRFSQNAEQAKNDNATPRVSGTGKFSYTLYDAQDRAKESGEYTGIAYQFNSLNAQLEFESQVNYGNDSKGWVKTEYDLADGARTFLQSEYTQKYTRGAVSKTLNANNQTWYSYDELGRVTWMMQKPSELSRVFVVQYKYSFSGKVLMVSNLAFKLDGTLLSQFYHHYEYDADQRLEKASTSLTENGTKKLRATYEYYMHGPLKRIELGDNIQGIDFVYNINGWLKQINHPDPTKDPGTDGNDVFGMILNYYESDLNNIYSSKSKPSGIDPESIHRNSMMGAYTNNQQPLIRFAPDNETEPLDLKNFSADNPVYQQMIQQQMNNSKSGNR